MLMAAMAIDTYKTIKRLKDNGFSEQQAETVTSIIVDIAEDNTKAAATKADLSLLEQAVKRDFSAFGKSVKDDIFLLDQCVKKDLSMLEKTLDGRFIRIEGEILLLKWMMGTIMAGIIALVIKAFFPHGF
jgi:hypothetical protein